MLIAGHETHPAADLFPLLEGQELKDLAADIKAHGLLNPIIIFAEGGKQLILDGRNRLRACELAGVAPRFEFWAGEGSLTEWVVSQNLHRRQLTTSQRALIAVELVPMLEAEAKERRIANLKQGSKIPESANLREREKGKATAKAAAAVNVSPRSVESALKVMREAPIETVAAVRRGDVTVSAAAKALDEAKLPKLPSSRKSRPPRSSTSYSVLLTMPTEEAMEIRKQLRALGFEPVRDHDKRCDAEMRLTAARRTA